MRLKKLILHGFKSFADHVEVTFEDGITGIVGPNGCGKSNIADAMRWVLGEQSAKTLRGQKMEDIIFNGTQTRRRLGYCEVSLVFDNEDHALPISFSEVSITRRVYRDGEADYKINGTTCRLKDIIDLFRDTGIGKDGYSIIGQGRIDEILSAKSEDRRQVFEEAAGIVKFKARKTEAEKRIRNTQENLSRVEDILTELEGRVEPLRLQSETARKYLQLRDELKVLDLNAFLVRSDRYEARLTEMTAQMQTLDEEIQNYGAELEALNRDETESRAAQEALEQEAAQARDRVQELIVQVETAEGENKACRERIAAENRERDRAVAQREAAMNGREGLDSRIDEMTKALERETEALQVDTTAHEAREQELKAREAQLTELENRIESDKARVIAAMNRLGDVRSQQARLSATQAAFERQIESMDATREREQKSADALAVHVADARAEMESERDRKQELDRLSAETQTKVQNVNASANTAQETLHALQNERQAKDSRLRLLREMQRDYEGYNNSVKQVLLQARRQGNAGVHGVVADILRVPAKLERAMDMVLGASLQNIVVDRDEDAKRMIEYLRNNRFGRATFLPIGSVRGRTLTAQERRVLNMPGCVGLASELIAFDPIYQGVVDNLLGRTVVAEDLNTGIAIQRAGGYQFRLVTLEGDVMHSGGSMTGGSVQSRMTSLLSRTREIEETEKALRELDAKIDKEKSNYEKLDAQRTQLKKERAELYTLVNDQAVILARAETQLKAALDEQESVCGRAAQSRTERERLIAQLEDVKASLEKLNATQLSEAGSTEALQAQIREEQNVIYGCRAETDALRKAVADERVLLATRKRGLQADLEERDRLREQSQDTEKLLKDTEALLADCAQRLAADTSSLEAGQQALASGQALLDAVRGSFNAADSRRIEGQKHLQTLSQNIGAARDAMDASVDRRHKAEVNRTRLDGEFKQLRDHIWEDYELTYAGAESFRTQDFKPAEAEKHIAEIRRDIRAMGSVNVSAVDDYRQTVERVTQLSAQRDDLLKAQTDLTGIIADLEYQMEKQFRTQFALINANFQKTFVRLFGGGRAELQLTDEKDALNCGIEVVAQPPGKKLQMLTLLSGGERALTAIAILFAILDLKPTPFCILDEIEAALDDANIDTYADYLKAYSKDTQFIVITHRKGTMERCDALYGIVMEEKGVSRTVSVRLEQALKEGK